VATLCVHYGSFTYMTVIPTFYFEVLFFNITARQSRLNVLGGPGPARLMGPLFIPMAHVDEWRP